MLHLERSQQGLWWKVHHSYCDHGGGSLMFWGFVSYKGGNLVKLDGKMNAACYQKILEENLHPSAWKLRMSCTWMFQHDKMTKSICHWLQQKKMEGVEWSSQSPDLNIMSHFRKISSWEVHARQPKNLQELEAFYQEEWATSILESKVPHPQLPQKTSNCQGQFLLSLWFKMSKYNCLIINAFRQTLTISERKTFGLSFLFSEKWPKITDFARVCYCYCEYNLWITLDVKSEERFSNLIFKMKCLIIGI